MKSFYKIFIVNMFIAFLTIGASAQNLEGDWKLISAKLDGERVVFEDEIKTNLAFGEENRLAGNSGCNRYSTSYTLEDGGGIEFAPVIATKMACMKGDLMKQERTFFQVIDKTQKYKIKGDRLIFFDAAKQNVLKFARVEKQNS